MQGYAPIRYADDAPLHIRVNPAHLIRILAIFAIFLTAATIAGNVLKYYYGHSFGLWRFDLDNEGCVASWFQASGLLFCALLLYAITVMQHRSGGDFVPHWLGLAIIFTYLSADEASQLHEWLTYALRPKLHTGGLFYFAWIIPAIPAMAIFLLSYLRFLRAMPKPDMRRFITSGCVYISGVAVMEALDGWYASLHGGEGHLNAIHTLVYSFQTTIEEDLETLGIILFIYTLLTYIRLRWPTFQVSLPSLPPVKDAS